MIKALLIVTALSGGGQYTTEMPSMSECLKARDSIIAQDASIKTLCVQRVDKTVEVQKMFDIFLNIIDQLKEYEELDRIDGEEDCFSRCGEGFYRKQPMG